MALRTSHAAVLLAPILAIVTVAACGGTVEEGVGDHDTASGSSGNHASSGASSIDVSVGTSVTTYTTDVSGSSFVTSSTVTTTTTLTNSASVSASGCIDVGIDPKDQTCTTSDDCTFAPTGAICAGQCDCGSTPVNQATASTVEAETAGLGLAECPCAAEGMPTCVFGLCVDCGGPNPPGGCPGAVIVDAGPPSSCVVIELPVFDTSCHQASDCVSIYAGELCDGFCACPNATINVSSLPEYDQTIAGIEQGECACPASNNPVCFGGQCRILDGDSGL